MTAITNIKPKSPKGRNQDLLKDLLENTEANLAYLDPHFNFVLVNAAYAKNSGYGKKQLIGQNYFQLFPNKENEKIFRQVICTGKSVQLFRKPFTYPNQPERGTTYWDWTLKPIKNNKKSVEGIVLSLVEVTEDVKSDSERERLLIQLEKARQRAEQLTMEAEKRASEMDAIFMAMADPLIVYNLKGQAVSVNPAMFLTFGFDPVGKSREEVIKKLSVRYPDRHPLPQDDMLTNQALAGKTVVSKPLLVKNSKDEDIAVLTSASPIFNKGKVAGAVVIMHDVSERLKLEQQKDEFIAIASHELKTPITTLKAFTQILQRRFEEKHDGNSLAYKETAIYLQRINGQLDKLSGLVKELLDVSRIESGVIPLHTEQLDFDQLIKTAIEDLQRITRRHRLIIRGETGKKIWGDTNRINQIITNLILNAVKYSPTSDRIIIHLLSNGHNVIVKVKDFGIGIDKENQAKIFDRFFRVKGASGERFPGLGLGLYISSEIVKAHGGKMWVKSTPGKGSTFFFNLPAKGRRKIDEKQ